MSAPLSALRVAFVSSYPPRECGIATFTQDLAGATKPSLTGGGITIAAINEAGGLHPYPPEVTFRIDQGMPETYAEAARFLNEQDVDVVSVQHEFGRFGVWHDYLREDHLAPFLAELKKPVVTTLHTILPSPHPTVKASVLHAVERSEAVMVMAKTGALMLMEEYGAPPEKIVYIPHGVPEVKPEGRRKLKAELGVSNRTVISTFGLLSPGKGLEYAVQAIARVVEKHPDVLYLIVGETHPDIRRSEGESYRNRLRKLAQELGIQRNVAFVNHYLNKEEIVEYLLMSDVFVTPYLGRNQITSGVLSYALGAGKAIVSTPYIYATEALAEHRGILAEFRSAESLANAIALILDDPEEKETLERKAYEYGRRMAWPNVGRDFATLLGLVVEGKPIVHPGGDLFRLAKEDGALTDETGD
jgi:glycosyltransferase involved in cell wall biosynthesis